MKEEPIELAPWIVEFNKMFPPSIFKGTKEVQIKQRIRLKKFIATLL